ncbi:MAG TPA: LamG-like jellyroll fold domain-containing protein [Catenuloplanes sp.]
MAERWKLYESRLKRVGASTALVGLMATYAVVGTGGPAAAAAPAPASVQAPAVAPESPVGRAATRQAGPARVSAFAAEDGPVRDTEDEAIAEAVRSKAPVEIGALRGESREVFANPDGTTTAVEHAQPVRVVRAGRWVKADPTLVKAPDGSIVPKAAPLSIKLSAGDGTSPAGGATSPTRGDLPLVKLERAGRSMTLDWPGRLPAPTLAGDRATYPEVFEGVDLVVTVATTGFSHLLVIKNAAAARNPELAQLDFTLKTDGLTVREDTDGTLTATDNVTGGAVLESASPMMWDSGAPAAGAGAKQRTGSAQQRRDAAADGPADNAKRAEVGVVLGANSLTLVPDQAMLTDPTTQWPVYVDPIWEHTRNSGWAMVDKGYPAQEYWNFRNDEGVGECPVVSRKCENSKIKQLFYALPTPYQGKTILEAKFGVTMTHTFDGSRKNVSLYRASKGIGPGTNWNNRPEMSVHQETWAPTATQDSCAAKPNVYFNAKPAVQEAVANGWGTTTFGLRAQNEADHTAWKRFCNNALLSVRFNRPPSRPALAGLTMSPGGVCVSGANRPYVDRPPTLYMVLKDPDHSARAVEDLRGEVQIGWNSADGTRTTRTIGTDWKASDSLFSVPVPHDIPQNTVISWSVRATDGTAWGPWGWADGQSVCDFVYDSTKPPAPDIDSPEYLPNDASETTSACVENTTALGAVGRYGRFTFDSPGTDAMRYEYGFNGDPSPHNVLVPAEPGGPVSVQWMPEEDGDRWVSVRSVDRANNVSTTAICHFDVANRRPAGEWALADIEDARVAADAGGRNPATAGAGVTFGVPGPGCQYSGERCAVDYAVRLSGAADGHLSTANSRLVDTATGFGATAWVRLTNDRADAVAVSQDGTGEPGFTLGFDAASRKWAFKIPATDIDSFGGWTATSTTDAASDTWTHLAATYDPVRQTMQLYVNGQLQSTVQRRSAWRSHGPVQIGRRTAKSGYTGHWTGDIADVSVYDRVVAAREITEVSRVRAVRVGYWPLEVESGGRSPGDAGADLLLGGGARVYTADPNIVPPIDAPLVGAGHLVLDGVDDHARTDRPVATTDGSFSVAMRVRLSSGTCGKNMTAVSQAGSAASAFAIRCTAANRWELVLPHTDGAHAPATVVFDNAHEPTADQIGQQVAVTYNSFLDEVKLYVDGQVAATGTGRHAAAWKSNGGLQVGRSLTNGVFGDYLAGVVDDVRVYTGVADDTMIQRMALPQPGPDL